MQVKAFYGDGSADSYISTCSYEEAKEAAREKARQHGTFLRGFSRVDA